MTRFSAFDYGIFVAYLAASVLVGVLFVKEQRSLRDYFLAGSTMGSGVVAISVLAALFSGITYLGAPAEVYVHDFSFVLIGLSFFVATPITALLFLPHFYQRRYFTAFQYLEERFSRHVRMLASGLFVIRVLFWLALATYAPALALEQVTGLPLWLSLVCTAALTTFYTTMGGMKAVIWTDVMQFCVLFGGQILIIATALRSVPGGVEGVYEINRHAGKFSLNLSLDPTARVTLWGLLLGGAFINLVQIASDQVSVQRYLTARSMEGARRSLWIKLALTLPVITLFYVSGLVLYAFYQSAGDPLKAGRIASGDQILPYFVIHQLPIGMPGLLLAAIFAASMSTVSAGLNAMTTTTLVDFYAPPSRRDASDRVQIRLARYVTCSMGASSCYCPLLSRGSGR